MTNRLGFFHARGIRARAGNFSGGRLCGRHTCAAPANVHHVDGRTLGSVRCVIIMIVVIIHDNRSGGFSFFSLTFIASKNNV